LTPKGVVFSFSFYQAFMQCGMQAAYSTMHMWNSLWWVLAVESINGITFACFWPAGTLHCTKIAPPGMAATVQVIHTILGLLLCCPVQTQQGLDEADRHFQLHSLFVAQLYILCKLRNFSSCNPSGNSKVGLAPCRVSLPVCMEAWAVVWGVSLEALFTVLMALQQCFRLVC